MRIKELENNNIPTSKDKDKEKDLNTKLQNLQEKHEREKENLK